MNEIVGKRDILMLVLDTLRLDVAEAELARGRTPHLAALLPGGRWEKRHAPGNFTFSSHQAFFAGFLPTPATPGKHPRLFALRFQGSETTANKTCVLDAPNIVAGLAHRNYETICIGGVGFFNKENPLGCVLPHLFSESHWSTATGVTDPRSTENQVRLAVKLLDSTPSSQRVFMFINVSAVHQPNHFYLAGGPERDSIESHAAALAYVDSQLPPLFEALGRRGGALCIVCSDHGEAYGEDGFHGHRMSHPVVMNVPYAEFLL